FALSIQSGNPELAAQRRLDSRQTDDLLLFLEALQHNLLLHAVDVLSYVAGNRFLLDKNHRHAAPDVIAGGAIHQITAVAIEADVDLRSAIFVIARLSVSHLITGNNQAALKRYRR